MDASEKAENALYDRIAEKAKDANADELKTLSESFSNVAYGPQGGGMHNVTNYNYNARYLGDKRPPVGFGPRVDSEARDPGKEN